MKKTAVTHRPLERSLPLTLLRTREAVFKQFAPELRAMGLTAQQWRVLRVLNELDDLSMSELAQQSFVMLPSLSRIVKNLVKQGYIDKKQSDTDQRSYSISLNPKGKEQVKNHRQKLEMVYEEIEATFGYGKLQLLFELLNELTDKCQQLNSSKTTEQQLDTQQMNIQGGGHSTIIYSKVNNG